MKSFLARSVLMLSLAVSGGLSAAQAQTATQQPDQTQQAAPQADASHGHRRTANPQRETKRLTKRLGLSSDQAAQVEPILADRAQRMAALDSVRGDQTSTRAQRRAILQDTKQKLDAVLTPAQQQQLAEMRHGHGRHGDEQQATPSPSSSL